MVYEHRVIDVYDRETGARGKNQSSIIICIYIYILLLYRSIEEANPTRTQNLQRPTKIIMTCHDT